jgi:hypothetical protein
VATDYHRSKLQGGYAALLVTNPDDLINLVDEDFAVADFTGRGGSGDGVDHLFGKLVVDHDLYFDLGKQIDAVFVAVIRLGVSLLAAVAADFGNRHAVDAHGDECVFYSVKL